MTEVHGVALTDAELEEYEERAAIIEFDANVSRDVAEAAAVECVLQRRASERG